MGDLSKCLEFKEEGLGKLWGGVYFLFYFFIYFFHFSLWGTLSCSVLLFRSRPFQPSIRSLRDPSSACPSPLSSCDFSKSPGHSPSIVAGLVILLATKHVCIASSFVLSLLPLLFDPPLPVLSSAGPLHIFLDYTFS